MAKTLTHIQKKLDRLIDKMRARAEMHGTMRALRQTNMGLR